MLSIPLVIIIPWRYAKHIPAETNCSLLWRHTINFQSTNTSAWTLNLCESLTYIESQALQVCDTMHPTTPKPICTHESWYPSQGLVCPLSPFYQVTGCDRAGFTFALPAGTKRYHRRMKSAPAKRLGGLATARPIMRIVSSEQKKVFRLVWNSPASFMTHNHFQLINTSDWTLSYIWQICVNPYYKIDII